MNILYTIFSLGIGGAEKLLVDIVNNWDKNSGDNVYVCIINNRIEKSLLDKIDNNINVIQLNRTEGDKNIKYLFQYMNVIRKYKIDIIHCQSNDTVRFSLFSKLINPKIRIFYTVHATNTFKNLSKIDVFVNKLMCNKIIAISSSVYNEIVERNVNKNKIEIVYNGIDLSNISIRKKEHENINIACVARLIAKTKGQDILIKSIRIVRNNYPNIKCYLVGDANNIKDREELKKLVDDIGLDNEIVFTGNLDNVPKFLESIDIFVLPSRYEGFGLALIEAMAAKIPVIASNIDGPKEIIKDNKYGTLFESESVEDLAKKIIKVIESNDEIKIEKAYKYVNNNYSIKEMVNNLSNIYSL